MRTNHSCNNFFNSITYQLDEFAPFKKGHQEGIQLNVEAMDFKGNLGKM